MKKVIFLVLTLVISIGIVGCAKGNENTNESAMAAYSRFLSGDRALLDEKWSDGIPDLQDTEIKYEYTYLDLDGDGVVELIVQCVDDPGTYNAVFHFDDEQIFCWQSDMVEQICRDYPLQNGMMVTQYDYNGTQSYKLFRYKSTGEKEEISQLFAGDDQYYTIDGKEVDKEEFDKQLNSLITELVVKRTEWKEI